MTEFTEDPGHARPGPGPGHGHGTAETPAEAAWGAASAHFRSLGGLLARQYVERANLTPEAQQQVEDAVATISEAVGRSLDAVGEAVADPVVQEEARTAAESLVTALGLTFDQVASGLREAVEPFVAAAREAPGEQGAPAEPAQPPAEPDAPTHG